MEVSAIGLGTWAFGVTGDGHGPVDDRESIAAIHQALECGINFIDTAPIDGLGHGEEIVGKAIQGRRQEVVLATKCGLRFPRTPDEAPQRCLAASYIFRECEASLRRLRAEVIDLYQCHWPDPQTPIEETVRALIRLLDDGKIRAVGLCNFDSEQIAAARLAGPVHCVQAPFSMLQLRARDSLWPYCMEHGIAGLPYACLARGLLTGAFDLENRPSDARAKDPEFTGARFRRNLGIVSAMRPIARQTGKTLTQVVINWTANEPGVTAPIIGARRLSDVLENVGGVGWSLSPPQRADIEAILRSSDLAA